MVDIERLKEFLDGNPVIPYGETLSYEVIELLRKYPSMKRRAAFAPATGPKKVADKFKVECVCPDCGTRYWRECGINAIYQTKPCPACEGKRKEAARIQREQEDKARKMESLGRTLLYCDDNLDIEKSWNPGIKVWQMKQDLLMPGIDHDIVSKEINKMDYHEFLATPYWKGVSAIAMKKANYRCELCGNQGVLNVHHKTYEHHGKEILYPRDLICLCSECHQKFHDKIKG